MLAQLNAQKPVKKKTSHEMPSSSPGTYIFLSGIEQKYHLKYQVLPPKKEKKIPPETLGHIRFLLEPKTVRMQ